MKSNINIRQNKTYVEELFNTESVTKRVNAVKKHKELASSALNDSSWRVRYAAINNNYALPVSIIQKFAFDKDKRVSDKAKYMLDVLSKYVYREDFKDTISIKLVIPGGCNAKCFFCYGDGYKCSNKSELQEKFLNNFLESLEEIILRIEPQKKVSLDITGGEPTLDSKYLIKVLNKLRNFYLLERLDKVTLTSNGFRLKEVTTALRGVVDYVNISIHHYAKEEREKIFGVKTFTDDEYKEIVLKLIDNDIIPSAVAIIFKQDDEFEKFRDNMISWAEEMGFSGVRFRKNAYWEDKAPFMDYINRTIQDGKYTYIDGRDTTNITWCSLKTKSDFSVYFVSGVPDTTKISLGTEFVVNDDGIAYTDFDKKQKVSEYNLPLGLVFDVKI